MFLGGEGNLRIGQRPNYLFPITDRKGGVLLERFATLKVSNVAFQNYFYPRSLYGYGSGAHRHPPGKSRVARGHSNLVRSAASFRTSLPHELWRPISVGEKMNGNKSRERQTSGLVVVRNQLFNI